MTTLVQRRAMTLVELLIVIVILTTLITVAIPLMAPSSSERQVREAARGLSAFLGAAQARAIANARPFGVAFKRLSADTLDAANNGVAVEAFIVEQPKPYSGFDDYANARFSQDVDGSGNPVPGQYEIQFVTRGTTSGDGLPPGWDAQGIPPAMLRPGDSIDVGDARFVFTDTTTDLDAAGFYEPIRSSDNMPRTSLFATPISGWGKTPAFVYDTVGNRIADASPSNPAIGPRFWTVPTKYKILRQPVPTSDEPYQLPEGTVVDLRASGVGDTQFFYWPGVVDNSENVMLMFAPEGRVERVRYNSAPFGAYVDQPVVDNIYLLVGPNVPAPPPAASDDTLTNAGWSAATTDEDKQRLREPINWLRGDSTWLVLGATTGRVVTNENAFVDPFAILAASPPYPFGATTPEEWRSNQIVSARRLARGMEQVGGR